jgi:hypothetical protein
VILDFLGYADKHDRLASIVGVGLSCCTAAAQMAARAARDRIGGKFIDQSLEFSSVVAHWSG